MKISRLFRENMEYQIIFYIIYEKRIFCARIKREYKIPLFIINEIFIIIVRVIY